MVSFNGRVKEESEEVIWYYGNGSLEEVRGGG